MKNNKKNLTYLGIFLGSLLILSAVFRLLTPQKQISSSAEFVSTNINQTTSDFSNVSFIGQAPAFPEKLSVGTIEVIENEDQVINKIIDAYGLETNSQSERYWTNQQNQYLHQDIYSKKYQLSLGVETATGESRLNLTQAINKAATELKNLFPSLSLSPLSTQVSFLKKNVEFYEKAQFEDADFITIPFSYTISNFPLKYQKENIDPFIIMLDKQGQIIRINFSPFFIKVSLVSNNTRISINQALTNLNNDQGSIITFGLEQGTKADLSVIQSAELDQISIEYRYDEKANLAYPFYRFSGTGQDQSDQTIQLEIITPAIETSLVE
jgi:hypothetical protein